MSSRKSYPTDESLSSSRNVERTPLRSLGNEIPHLSVSPRIKSKPWLSTEAVKSTKVDSPLWEQEPKVQSPRATETIQINAPNHEIIASERVYGLGDVTFKSMNCPGGEIEITDNSVCAEESMNLPKDQAMKNTCAEEDTFISDGVLVQSSCDHLEHPYNKPERKSGLIVDTDAAYHDSVSSNSMSSDVLDDKPDAGPHQRHSVGDTPCKSSFYDGGEEDVPDVTRKQDETLPFNQGQCGEPVEDQSVNITNLSDQPCEEEHADRPSCSIENGLCVITTFSETTDDQEKLPNKLSNVTFKSFICTGGEIEISDRTEKDEEAVPIPATQACTQSYSYGSDPSILTADPDLQQGDAHLDHAYCDAEKHLFTPSCDASVNQGPISLDAPEVDKQLSFQVSDSKQENIIFRPSLIARSEVEELYSISLSDMTPFSSEDQAVIGQQQKNEHLPTALPQDDVQKGDEQPDCQVEYNEAVVENESPVISISMHSEISLRAVEEKSVQSQLEATTKKTLTHVDDIELHSVLHKADHSSLVSSAEEASPTEEHQEPVSEALLRSRPLESSEAKDRACDSYENEPFFCSAAEKLQAQKLPEVLKSIPRCPSVAALQFGDLTPMVRRASLLLLKACKKHEADRFAEDGFGLEDEKSLFTPINLNPDELWAEHLESPMPRPLFNSTALVCKTQPDQLNEPEVDPAVTLCPMPQSEEEKPVPDVPFIQDGPLQQQLRQMAEFLILASGKVGPAGLSAPLLPAAAIAAPSPESHSVCVGTSPMKRMDHSMNTSGTFERKREFSVVDSCTLTDPLLWNVPPGSLECLPREELEQRLRSSMIMVEALVQQLAVARTRPALGPAPSDLREKIVQTEHTELSQTTMHRDLYLEALSRIVELELDVSSLQSLFQGMQDMKVTMTSLSRDTDAALTNMKQTGEAVREDHHNLVAHYGHMKSLFEKMRAKQTAMLQKVKEAFQQREDMRTQMEEAFTDKEAAFSVVEQLRTHCATEISELERIVGSHQDMLAALNQTCPEQVALNQGYTEILDSACDILSTTKEEQCSVMKELCRVRGLLQKAAPMLLKLNEKAAGALRERDEEICERDRAVEEREQIEEELNQANANLQAAREQIDDLKRQETILTSEMGVLRQMLSEREEERGQLERKVTELSATVSSTLASYAFLEQALASEATKLQQSWKETQMYKERAGELEGSLTESDQRGSELSRALAHSEEQLSQLQALTQSQALQIQQLQDVCTQLSGVREENEFLQMENELAREQIVESERTLRANLQGLRERNLQCEDLKGELVQLQLTNTSLQEELENTKSKASTTQLELGERLDQAVTEITLLHHTLRGLTNELHAALTEQKREPGKDKKLLQAERCYRSSSCVESVMVCVTAEKDGKTDRLLEPAVPDAPEPRRDSLFGGKSAFTRIPAVTPRKSLSAVAFELEEDTTRNEAELFADLSGTVTELISNMKLLREHQDGKLEELHRTICVLQGEQQATNSKHEAEVFDLKHQLNRLNSLVEKGSQALKQKTVDEKTMMKLMSDIQEAQDDLHKHKRDNNELRKEVAELRRCLQQAKVESKFLREEMMKAGGQSANSTHSMEEKIQLLKEVERLKLNLQEVEQARVKLRERANRNQIIHQSNQQKSENELLMLSNMIQRIKQTLLSLPELLKNSEQLQQLVAYIG